MPQYVQAYGQTIEFPDGMPQADIDAAIRKNAMDISAASQQMGRDAMKKDMGLDATDGKTQWLAGIGNGMASGVRALGGGSLLEKFGLPGTKEEADSLNQDLNKTTSGKIGTGLGIGALAAPLALVPGANTYLGATALGALSGGALTEGDAMDRAKGAAFGAAGGAAGKGLGDLLGWGAQRLMQSRASSQAAAQVANAQKDAALSTAQTAGYVVPPADVKSGFVNDLLNGLGGKIKTAQDASVKNQDVTNQLARKALGLADDSPLTPEILDQVRAQAGKAYADVSRLGEFDATKAALPASVKVSEANSPLMFGKTQSVDSGELVRAWRQNNADATAYFRSYARTADPETLTKARAASAAAKEIDDFLTSNVAAYQKNLPDKLISDLASGKITQDDFMRQFLTTGQKGDMVEALKEARRQIAKSYTVEKALNGTTGDVAAPVLAKELAKDKPLSGDLLTIAQVAQAFPKATQALKEAPKSVSPLDWALASITGASTGNPLSMAMLGARPAARALQLSGPYQRAMATPSYAPGLLDKFLLPNMSDDAMKLGLLGAGMSAGPMASR